MFFLSHRKGFTLIELLIVISILAVLAVVIFAALDPLRVLRDSRDVVRWNDSAQLMEAIKQNQVRDGGFYITAIDDMIEQRWYMITDGNGGVDMQTGCDANNNSCDVDIHDDGYCVDLDDLVTEGDIGDIPVNPRGPTTTWDEGDTVGENGTGYALYKDSNGILTIQSCESEGTEAISVIR